MAMDREPHEPMVTADERAALYGKPPGVPWLKIAEIVATGAALVAIVVTAIGVMTTAPTAEGTYVLEGWRAWAFVVACGLSALVLLRQVIRGWTGR